MLLMSVAKRPSRILLAGLAFSLVSAGLVVSGSVGSIVAASVATAAWFAARRTKPSRLVALTAVALVAVVVYTTQISAETPSSINRIMHLGSGSPDDPNLTLGERFTTYHIAIKRVEENPIAGVGLNRNTTAASEWVHNIFLGSWYTTGFFGLIGIILIFFGSARTAWSTVLEGRSEDERAFALALACSFTAFVVFLMSEPALFIRYGWVSVALICALRATQTSASEAQTSPEKLRYFPLPQPSATLGR
jgi:O-antigen ligase